MWSLNFQFKLLQVLGLHTSSEAFTQFQAHSVELVLTQVKTATLVLSKIHSIYVLPRLNDLGCRLLRKMQLHPFFLLLIVRSSIDQHQRPGMQPQTLRCIFQKAPHFRPIILSLVDLHNCYRIEVNC